MSNLIARAARLSATLVVTIGAVIAPAAFAVAPTISTVAGNGTSGFSGDGGQATSASMWSPYCVGRDPSGNLYFCDFNNFRIRKITPDGVISTFAGNGSDTGDGDGGAATSATVYAPTDLVVDSQGNVYITDWSHNRVRKVNTSGIISTYAGTGVSGYSGDGGPATSAKMYAPQHLAIDASNNLYIQEGGHIRKVTPAGTISTIAGNGTYGSDGDNGPATKASISAEDIAVDAAGSVYISEPQYFRIRKITTAGVIRPFAGTGEREFGGDGGPALQAKLSFPQGLAVDAYGNVVFADAGNLRVRRIDVDGIINTIAGTGAVAYDGGVAYNGENIPALSANMAPYDVSFDSNGALLVAEQTIERVRRVTPIAITVPNAPAGVLANRGNHEAVVDIQPGGSGGAKVDKYIVTSIPSGGVDANANSNVLSHRITGLTNGTSYTFSVVAHNAIGRGAATVSNAVIPAGVPGAPTSVVATVDGREVDVAFQAPSQVGDSAITGYAVTSSPAGGIDAGAGTTALSHHITNLQPGTQYTFRVVASNAAGGGSPSANSNAVQTLNLPEAPTGLAALAWAGTAEVSFVPPPDTGLPITSYQVVASPAHGTDQQAGTTATTHVFTGLHNGTAYTFTVRAMTASGGGATSQSSDPVTPMGVPGAPTNVVAVLDDHDAIVTFDAPTDDGGDPISGYHVIGSDGGCDADSGSTARSHRVSCLTAGQTYTFQVVAENSQGSGEYSQASNSVMPGDLPGAPTSVTVSPRDHGAFLTWQPPTDPGDFTITGYRFTASPGGAVVEVPYWETMLTFDGLQNGTAYSFAVQALTNFGPGAAAVTGTVTPDTPKLPGPPTSVSATINIPGRSAKITFSPPLDEGNSPVFAYYVTSDECPEANFYENGTSELQEYVNNLPANKSCSFRVTAQNEVGKGTPSSKSNAVVYDVPVMTIADVSLQEGNSGQQVATFNLVLSRPLTYDAIFNIGTINGTADSSDYFPRSMQMTLPAGSTGDKFEVSVKPDLDIESNETFTLLLGQVNGVEFSPAHAPTATIVNDDFGPPPSLTIDDVSTTEGNSGTKTLVFTVTLSAPQSNPVTFDIATANGSATAGSDYVARSITGASISAGLTTRTFAVTTNGDTTIEPNESFVVNLSNPSGATIADGQGVGTIKTDDIAATLSINDVSITEGNSSTKSLVFTVTLSAAQPFPVSFDLATADGSATAGSDYVARSLVGASIGAGLTTRTFAVTINGDTTVEPNETFKVNLTNASGATIADGQGVGTITSDDVAALPTLSINDLSISEGNASTQNLVFTVTLSAPSTSPVSFNVATTDGSATAGSDYVAKTVTGSTIAAGTTTKTFGVTIKGDTTVEPNETFTVNLSGASGATIADGQGVGTITNDDGPAMPTLSIADVSVAEGNSLSKQATFTVTLSTAASTAVTYNIATADGTAVAPGDYTAKTLSGESIPAGTLSKTFTVAVKGDRVVEPNETFKVNVTSVVGATVADGQATGTITNDDAATLSVARFDARGLVDDVDDGNRQPQIAPSEYATLLADSANALCRRASNATVIAVEGVEHQRVLSDLADAATTLCANKPQYTAVMADHDSRGFLIATPAKDELGTTVLGAPEVNAAAQSTTLSILGAGHATPVTVVLANGASKALFDQLQLRAKASPDEALVLLGANKASGLVDLTARALTPPRQRNALPVQLPAERVLVNGAMLKLYRTPGIELAPLPANETPAQLLKLQ